MEHLYELYGCRLLVFYDKKLVRILAPAELRRFLSTDIERRSLQLARQIKSDYLNFFGVALNISDDSMIVEIWGHVYASYVAEQVRKAFKSKTVAKTVKAIRNRSDHIDCGERDIDSNRIFWNVLANLKSLILLLIPKRIKQ